MNFFIGEQRDSRISSTSAMTLLLAFAILLALLGGASRPDAVQLVALRPLVGLFMIAAIYYISRAQLESVKPILVIAALFALWMGLQLVPLPPSLWQSLPGREAIVTIDQLAGSEEIWRPISITPSRGLNAFLSLVVPISALLLGLSMRASSRLLLLLIAGLGLIDAVWGLLQVISGRTSLLYAYAITNRGSPVGLFANENHSAVFSAMCLLVIARLGAQSSQAKDPTWLRLLYPPSFLIVLFALLVSGSRAGLAVGLLSISVAALIVFLSLRSRNKRGRGMHVQAWMVKHPRTLLASFAGLIALIISLFVTLERAPAFEGILNQSAFDDLRWMIVPILQQMIETHWLFGTGFGSWDKLYLTYEPTAFLMQSYVNQAHNDWAQVVIEGGAPAVLFLLVALGWIARSIGGLIAGKSNSLAAFLFWGAIFGILCAASVVDYPLRTPVFQAVGIWLFLALSFERAELQQVLK